MGARTLSASSSVHERLAEVEKLIVSTEHRANTLDRLSMDADNVSQLSDTLDALLQLKLSRDLLLKFATFNAADPTNEPLQ